MPYLRYRRTRSALTRLGLRLSLNISECSANASRLPLPFCRDIFHQIEGNMSTKFKLWSTVRWAVGEFATGCPAPQQTRLHTCYEKIRFLPSYLTLTNIVQHTCGCLSPNPGKHSNISISKGLLDNSIPVSHYHGWTFICCHRI